MEPIFHRLFQKDLRAALGYYDEEGGPPLGDRFFDDVEWTIKKVEENPKRFHFIAEGLRSAQLKTFPYHIVFEESESRLRFLILRHDKRHPSFGIRRR